MIVCSYMKNSHHKVLIWPAYIIYLPNLAQLISWADIQRTQSIEHATFNCCLPESCAAFPPSNLKLGTGAGVNELAKPAVHIRATSDLHCQITSSNLFNMPKDTEEHMNDVAISGFWGGNLEK